MPNHLKFASKLCLAKQNHFSINHITASSISLCGSGDEQNAIHLRHDQAGAFCCRLSPSPPPVSRSLLRTRAQVAARAEPASNGDASESQLQEVASAAGVLHVWGGEASPKLGSSHHAGEARVFRALNMGSISFTADHVWGRGLPWAGKLSSHSGVQPSSGLCPHSGLAVMEVTAPPGPARAFGLPPASVPVWASQQWS